ncbi:CueP family metal-binding protein [Planomonospora sp. ID91781]|uniref:CueP family metal-binding protein n=1 Tax=Planomonospora sp. ID91781 TaxID=2738135 RepID=UPI0018C37284|nr:CueP family metal-binding protein [Planomonospora sp. ID91781]MBG0823622.1 CueP family metal-binding protein [Planomonospora sp. ID91781]
MNRKRTLFAAAVSALVLTGCAGQSGGTTSTAPSTASPAPSAPASAAPQTSAAARTLLSAYGLTGKDAVQIIDHLDRLGGAERPADLKASVRPGELALSGGGQEVVLPLPADRFYLSVAPYTDRTHECFHHSLTTCAGELAGKDMQVTITDAASGEVLVDETRTTFANGFTGFWLPRGIDGTVTVAYGGRTGQAEISTGQDAPTCLTTLRLA